MTSERQIAANRNNARKSTGPRTRRGKARVSRNALSHGLGSVNSNAALSDQVQSLAKAMCKDVTDPFLYEQALIFADAQIFLGRIRAARVETIERARKEMNMSEREPRLIPGFPTRDEFRNIYEYFGRGELRKVANIMKQMTAAIKTARERLAAGLPIWPGTPNAKATDCMNVDRKNDDLAYFIRALPELLALDRYERRALSRRRRAIQMF
jgi:hypothetical protein